jgi:excisionase family DNA binding protein
MEIYLTITELAGMVKLSKQTVRRYVLSRTIPCHKIRKAVRFRLSEIERWIESGGMAADKEPLAARGCGLSEAAESKTAGQDGFTNGDTL